MTAKDEEVIHDTEKQEQDDNKTGTSIDPQEQKIASLEKKLAEQEEITKRAQSDYFRLKMDMDGYIKRADEWKKSEKIDALVNMWSKVLPLITQLEQSIEHMPEAIASDAWADWLRLMHQKAMSDVFSLGIVPITTDIGMDPDLTLHMPINMQDTDDETLKWKIVQVIEWGWKYDKNWVVKIISPSKIVVGS